MKAFLGNAWRGGVLDAHRCEHEIRIQVVAWKNFEALQSLYFIRPRSVRMVWNYVHTIGIRQLVLKILSRFQEALRNEKYVSCGLGRVIETGRAAHFTEGEWVAFLAPNHPPCLERVVLPEELCISIKPENFPFVENDYLLYLPANAHNAKGSDWFGAIRGWHPLAGLPLSTVLKEMSLQNIIAALKNDDWSRAQRLHIPAPTLIKECDGQRPISKSPNKKEAVLVGYGNYAKTTLLPYIKPYVLVKTIHEIDPTQIPLKRNSSIRWDTSPEIRPNEAYDVYLIAGYHHTHAPLAIQALRKKATVVVEKPLVVNRQQLDALLLAMQSSRGQLFCCLQRRYSPFNAFAVQDLDVSPGDPISYHCIVFEVPLPQLHWYLWPSSQSRLISHGCHWLDHFLYLNGYGDVETYDIFVANNDSVNCSVKLKNGAFFTMVITDRGCQRIGMQNYIELRANGASVKINNDGEYISENNSRIIRKTKKKRNVNHIEMYRQIGQKIIDGSPGDSLEITRRSWDLVLAFEERFSLLRKEGVNPENSILLK